MQEIDNEQFVQVSIDCQGDIPEEFRSYPELQDNARFVNNKFVD